MNILKECTKCLVMKPLEEFRRQTANKDGRSYYCIQCLKPLIKANNEKRYATKGAELIEKAREWQRRNPDKVREYNKTYREKQKKLSAAAPTSSNAET